MRAAIGAVRNAVLGASPWIPHHGRFGLESLTAAEFTAALGSDTPGALVEDLRIEIDSRGTTDRARIHLQWNDAGTAAGLAPTAFAKGTSSQLAPRVIVAAFGCHTYEARFFQQIQPALADITIEPYVSRSGSGGRYVIAFEDLALRDGGVTFYNADDDASLSHAEAVIDLLAKLHGRFWRSPRFDNDLGWLQTYARRPGGVFMKHFFTWSEQRFMKQDRVVPETVRRLTKTYVENQAALTRLWESLPVTLCHGDTHLGNTFANADSTAGIYDWQVFHKMNGLRDFAYFLMHSVPTELRRSHEKDLLVRYLEGLSHHGAGTDAPSLAEAWDLYRLLTVDGWIAIVFTLAAGGMQPEDRMEVCAARAINTLVDLDVEQALRAAL